MNPWVFVILLALLGLALLSWSVRALDAGGAAMAFALGLVVALYGDLKWLALMVAFSVVGMVATMYGIRRKERMQVAQERGGERGWRNVLANGAAPTMAAIALAFVDPLAAALAFAAALASVTADTMASELGTLSKHARFIVPPFAKGKVGENGCVSWLGQSAALAGATIIGLGAIPLLGIPASLAWVPILGGFVGCQLDSVLGATLERDDRHARPLSNEDVNFLSSAIPALVVIIALG